MPVQPKSAQWLRGQALELDCLVPIPGLLFKCHVAVSSLTSLCLNFLICKNGGNVVPTSWDCSIYFMGSNELPSVKRLEPYLSHGKHSGDKTTTHRKKDQYLKHLTCIEFTCVKYKVMVGSDVSCRQSII